MAFMSIPAHCASEDVVVTGLFDFDRSATASSDEKSTTSYCDRIPVESIDLSKYVVRTVYSGHRKHMLDRFLLCINDDYMGRRYSLQTKSTGASTGIVNFDEKKANIAENMRISNLDSDSVYVGDVYKFCRGDTPTGVILQVSQPRNVCGKPNKYLRCEGRQRPSTIMEKYHITGWFFRLIEPGIITVGDRLVKIHEENPKFSVSEIIDYKIARDKSMSCTDKDIEKIKNIIKILPEDYAARIKKKYMHLIG